MTSTSKPAIVLVHGAWHRPEHWQVVSDKLEAANYDVVAPALPSCKGVAIAEPLRADVAVVRDAIEQFTSTGKNVVLVMHSYAGCVGSEALAEVEEKRATSEHSAQLGRIVHAFYVAAMIVERECSVMGENFSPMAVDIEGGMIHHLEPYNRFYNTTGTSRAWRAIGLLNPILLEAFLQETKYQGWSDYGVPVTYLVCEKDMAIQFEVDTPKLVARLEKANLIDFTKKTLDCDHTPWMSKEDEFMAILWNVIERSSGQS